MFDKKIKKSFLFKTVNILLLFSFMFYNVSYAVPENDIAPPEVDDSAQVLSVEDIGIAIDCGTVKSKYTGDSGKTIIHIQDAHCNYEAQFNINKILDQVTRECGVNMISVEGAEGTVDTAWFKAFPDAEIRKEVADYFMKKGEITGTEFFSINSDYNGTIFGAETREYYIKNLKAFTEVYPHKKAIEKYLKDMKSVAERLKSIVYTPELKDLDSKIIAFDERDLELSDFADYLSKSVEKNSVNIKDCGNLAKLLQTLEYEKKIDFDIVDEERSNYIDALGKILSKEEMTDLVAKSIRFKKGHIKAVEFYSYLRDLAKEHNIPIVQEYPNLFYYYIYTKLYEGIDNEALFKEIDLVERRLKDSLFKNDTQRTLDKYAEMIDMFVNLSNIELTNDDYDHFQAYYREFSLEDVLGFMEALSNKYGLNYSLGELPGQISENIPNMINFYEVAMKRDHALIANTLKRMEEENTTSSVLIAGGFHTKGIKDLLEEKGISYIVVTPKITKDVETPYIKVLTNQRTSLEDIITESAAMPGVASAKAPEAKTEMLGPVLAVGFGANKIFDNDDEGTLRQWSDEMETETEARTLMERVEDVAAGMVERAVSKWITALKESIMARYEIDELVGDARAEWESYVTSDSAWDLRRSMFLRNWLDGLREVKGDGGEAIYDALVPIVERTFDAVRAQEFEAMGAEGRLTSGQHDATGQILDNEQAAAYDAIIKASFDAAKKPEMVTVNIKGRDFIFVIHDGLIKSIMEANKAREARGLPLLPVNIHPGTGGKGLRQAHIDRAVWNNLNGKDKNIIARHELAHVDLTNGRRLEREMIGRSPQDVRKEIAARYGEEAARTWDAWNKAGRPAAGEKEESFVNNNLDKFRYRTKIKNGTETRINSGVSQEVDRVIANERDRQEALAARLSSNALKMARAASENEGPGIVIVVNSSKAQADFWQRRLTGPDGLRGSGAVIKKDALVFSVDESNWDGRAGNGLGTLNGVINAARMAREQGLIRTTPGLEGKEEIADLVRAFTAFSRGKSPFMFHTAGSGTRTAPFPASEANSKPNMKLPELVDVGGELKPITILESVIRQSSIDSYGREDRLSVVWGDQVIIRETPSAKPTHHVEIAGQRVPLDDSIKSYGILVPVGSEGGAQQREKLTKEKIKELYGEDTTEVLKSIGSFNLSLEFLSAMLLMDDNLQALSDAKGKSDTDPDWWQPLTSDKNSFVSLVVGKLIEKGESQAKIDAAREKASSQWEKMNSLWQSFKTGDRTPLSKDNVLGYNDVGENAQWWDYGRNEIYFRNMRLLLEDSPDGKIARQFFGLPEDKAKWIDQKSSENIGRGVTTDNSIIQNSSIKSGRVVNSIIIDSTLEHVDVENAIVIGSTIIQLEAKGAIAYNVVEDKVKLADKEVLVNAFHPREGKISLRTTISRDGKTDWDNKEFVFDNIYTYPELQKLMEEPGVTLEAVEALKSIAVGVLLGKRPQGLSETTPEFRESLRKKTYSEQAELLRDTRNAKKGEGEADLTLADARKIIVKRLIRSGEVRSNNLTVPYYKNTIFNGSPEITPEGAVREIYEINEELKLESIDRYKAFSSMPEPAFGTSGIRARVPEAADATPDEGLTDIQIYTIARGFVRYLLDNGIVAKPDAAGYVRNVFTIAGDRRPSTPRIMAAVGKAIEDEWESANPQARGENVDLELDWAGKIPSPSAAYRGTQKKSIVVIVTGSHIPFDMNGVKFYLEDGEELLKEHEGAVKAKVKEVREEEFRKSWDETLFDENGKFKEEPQYNITENQEAADNDYYGRYTQAFPEGALQGKTIVFWKHSAVGRDILHKVFESLGANVEERESSEEFVAVDTELVTGALAEKLRSLAASVDSADGVVFTDGDSDRPGVTDENGEFVTGDKLGLLGVKLLAEGLKGNEKLVIAVPVSTNAGVVEELRSLPQVSKVVLTRIGSPHVIKAMNEAVSLAAPGETVKAVGWEANGGFLLGSDFDIPGGGRLTKLATRDSVFPILAAYELARIKGLTLSELFEQELPAGATYSVGYRGFQNDFGISREEALAIRADMIALFSPDLKDNPALDGKDRVVEATYDTSGNVKSVKVRKRTEITEKGQKKTVDLFETEDVIPETIYSKPEGTDLEKWISAKTKIDIALRDKGFAPLKSLNVLDGIRMVFDDGTVMHLRPSGNDPVFRAYAYAPVPGNLEQGVSPVEAAKETAEEIGTKALGTRAREGVIPWLARTALKLKERITAGIHPFRAKNPPAGGTDLATAVKAVKEGKEPVFINPYLQEKIWGKRRGDRDIGEDWFGAGIRGENTSEAAVAGVSVPLTELLSYTAPEFIGRGTGTFGDVLPLIKILSPSDWLSVQLHTTKDELWVVTEIDEALVDKENPGIILGFSEEAIARYKDNIKSEYQKALETYGEKLNVLLNLLADDRYEAVLKDTGHAGSAAERVLAEYQDNAVQSAYDAYNEARKELNSFYHFEKDVHVGSVIAIPSGTLHALPPGYSVYEPQIAGDTTSFEDQDKVSKVAEGRAYARYPFKGQPGTGKELDTDKTDLINPKPYHIGDLPMVPISDSNGVQVVRFPGGFEPKGLAIGNIIMDKNTVHSVENNDTFHSIVLQSGSAVLVIEGKEYGIPKPEAGKPMLFIPASVKNYEIRAGEEGASVIDTFVPVPEVEPVGIPFESADLVPGETKASTAELGVYEKFGTTSVLTDRLEVNAPIAPPSIIGERPHTLIVQSGEILLADAEGNILKDKDEPVVFSEGEVLKIDGKGIKTEDGKTYAFEQDSTTVSYTIRRASNEVATVKVDYEKTKGEKMVYAVYETVKKHMPAIRQKQVDLLLPSNIFVKGGVTSPGSAEWLEKQVNEALGSKDLVKIMTYVPEAGLEKASERKSRDGAVTILGASKGTMEKASDSQSPDVKTFLNNVRMIALPDMKAEVDGWFFNWEVVGVGLLQAILDGKDIDQNQGVVPDMLNLMSELTERPLQRKDLYFMLPFADSAIPEGLREEAGVGDSFAWMMQVLHRLLLQMPIEPFDPQAQLQQRRKVMWSV